MRKYLPYAALAFVAAAGFGVTRLAQGSDHADTPELASNPGADLSDVYIFPSPTNSNNVVLVMNVHPLITGGDVSTVGFDPNTLYQFKIDNTGDSIEDKVIQVKFNGTGAGQTYQISRPSLPNEKGTANSLITLSTGSGTLNNEFNPFPGTKVFAGVREDPFFFDLERFFEILPDRATPINGIPVADPNVPKKTSWRDPGVAVDFLSNGNYNVLSIVVELPKSDLL